MPEIGADTPLKRFLASRVAVPVGLILTTLFCASILYVEMSGTLCFGTLLIAISAYLFPRYFGLKEIKRTLAWGLVFLLVISGIGMVLSANFYDSGQSQSVSSSNGNLFNATVSPTSASDDTTFIFSVVVLNDTYDNVYLNLGTVGSVYLNYIIGGEVQEYLMSEDLNYTGTGSLYYVELNLSAGSNYFFTVDGTVSGEVEDSTSISPWPLLISGNDLYVFYLMGNLYYLSLNVGLPFFVLAVMSWWIRLNMEKTIAKMREEGKIPPSEVACPACGSANNPMADRCVVCGGELVPFQPLMPAARRVAPKETFVCSECGKDVDADAEVCPHCGEPFDE